MSYEGVEDKRRPASRWFNELCRAADPAYPNSAKVQTASSRDGVSVGRQSLTRFGTVLVGGSPMGGFGFGDFIGAFFDGRFFFFAGFAVFEMSAISLCSMIKTITHEH